VILRRWTGLVAEQYLAELGEFRLTSVIVFLCLAKIPADGEIHNIAAAPLRAFCYSLHRIQHEAADAPIPAKESLGCSGRTSWPWADCCSHFSERGLWHFRLG
jgi:hypothetical protein